MLKPRLANAKAGRLTVLDTKAGSTPRVRGRRWLTTRRRIAVRDSFCCALCGRVWNDRIDHVDHRVPLEAGGSNDDANLQLLCVDCHARKTAAEAAERFRQRQCMALGGGGI
ncbi:HNH endonuclease [Caballeronia sp. GaOx3]|uniref:HNH endonuclease n=1 Tax=Caballeronia sp. GaOx3 TaxID=2921740 RepID=UPI00202895A6|nr:HNH endonuclease signature motif containing protein [Caballeronia sp. GaOx3]